MHISGYELEQFPDFSVAIVACDELLPGLCVKNRGTPLSLVVHNPALDIAGVLGHSFYLTRVDVYTIQVGRIDAPTSRRNQYLVRMRGYPGQIQQGVAQSVRVGSTGFWIWSGEILGSV